MPPRFWRVKVFFNGNEGVLQFNCLSLKCLKEDREDLVLTEGEKGMMVHFHVFDFANEVFIQKI